MEKPRLLIVEDAHDVADLLYRGLTEEGFEVEIAHDGETAMRKLSTPWNLIILDLNLPDITGEEILDFVAQRPDHPAVLILTARERVEDKVSLFKKGCDDYLVKPFAFEELLGRVRALLRRPARVTESLQYGDLVLMPEIFQISAGNLKVILTPKEFALCRRLMSEPGKVISKRELLHSVWGMTQEPKTNYIDVHVTNLRKKLGQIGKEDWLQTVRGSGLYFGDPKSNHGS